MGKLAVLVTIITMATACTWRDCACTTAYAVGSTAVLFTGNADAYGVHENIGGQAAEDLVGGLFDAASAAE